MDYYSLEAVMLSLLLSHSQPQATLSECGETQFYVQFSRERGRYWSRTMILKPRLWPTLVT